jgi:hypothetical protein
VRVHRFTPADVESKFDQIFKSMYPGEAVNEEAYLAGEVEPQRQAPFQFADWREVGVTTKMIDSFCRKTWIGLRVLYKNTIIYQNDIETDGETTVIVYHIHNDHAFFYDDEAVKRGAVQLRSGPNEIQVTPGDVTRLRTQADEDSLVPFCDMQEFHIEDFLQQIKDDISKTFYCYQRNVLEIKEMLEKAGVLFWVGLGARPEIIRSLNVCQKKTDKSARTGRSKNREEGGDPGACGFRRR